MSLSRFQNNCTPIVLIYSLIVNKWNANSFPNYYRLLCKARYKETNCTTRLFARLNISNAVQSNYIQLDCTAMNIYLMYKLRFYILNVSLKNFQIMLYVSLLNTFFGEKPIINDGLKIKPQLTFRICNMVPYQASPNSSQSKPFQ